MRDRTWVGSDGSRHDGAAMIGALWDAGLAASTGSRRQEYLGIMLGELRHAVADRPDGEDLIDEMLALGRVRRLDDGRLVDDSDRRPGGDAAEVA